jgi:hypothetical protein
MRVPATVEMGDKILASEAAKRYGVKLNTLDHRIDDGLIPGAEAIPVGSRVIRVVDPVVFEEYVANRPECGKDGCDRKALIGSDGCCGPHARAIATKGTTLSVETRQKMSIGKEFTPRRDVSERYKREWREGGPLVDPLLDPEKKYFKGRTRQKWKCIQNATKAPRPGALPRGRERLAATDEQRAEIERLSAAGWGRRAIANRMQLSERLVRNTLAS